MDETPRRLDRRTFLKVGGGALAAAATPALWAQTAAPPPQPIILQSARLKLLLDRSNGLPYEYQLLKPAARFLGADISSRVAVTVCDRRTWQFATIPVAAASANAHDHAADFHFIVEHGGARNVSFALRYELKDATVVVSMRAVRESDGHELIEVALPHLVTLREEDGAVWLAHGDTGGSVVALKDATAGSLAPNRFWGKVLATLPVVMIGTERALCVQEVTSFMDGTELQVLGEPGERRVTLGTVKAHRVNGSLCYDMNTGNEKTQNCGNTRTPNLLIGQESSCRLDFLAPRDTQRTATWLDGAELVRRRMPRTPNHLYDDAFVYGILVDQPGFETPSTTFEQCEALIRRIAALTDHAPQIVHLWGFQYRGKDTGYPAVDQVNERIGGYDGMMRLMERARELNCRVTLSDNYDDAYRSSPEWDPATIARRPDGELWESRNWTGENSYILGLAKYMRGAGRKRVRYTCEHYKLPGTTHIDVLSYYPIRNDWDREQPASGIDNLVEGRYRVLAEYAKHDVDVTSEALRYAFIGRISQFWNITGMAACPFGGKPIPLLTAVYSGSATYGNPGRSATLAERLVRTFFYNAPAHTFFRNNTDPGGITDMFYLMMVPWFKLHARNVETFQRHGERTTIGLEGNAVIDLDWSRQTYSLAIDGAEVARDGSTFCPLGDDRIAFYSSRASELVATLPEGWDESAIAAFALGPESAREVPIAAERGKLKVSVAAQQPVMVYRDGATARSRLLG